MDALVLAFVGDDMPGLVHALAEVLADHGGNWEHSEMTSVAGVFAGILQVTVSAEESEALVEDFRALDGMLDVTVRHLGAVAAGPEGGAVLAVEAVGDDRGGIVETLTATIARAGCSMERFTTTCVDDAHGGPRRFVVGARIADQDGADLDALAERLSEAGESLAISLTVDGPTTAGSPGTDRDRSS